MKKIILTILSFIITLGFLLPGATGSPSEKKEGTLTITSLDSDVVFMDLAYVHIISPENNSIVWDGVILNSSAKYFYEWYDHYNYSRYPVKVIPAQFILPEGQYLITAEREVTVEDTLGNLTTQIEINIENQTSTSLYLIFEPYYRETVIEEPSAAERLNDNIWIVYLPAVIIPLLAFLVSMLLLKKTKSPGRILGTFLILSLIYFSVFFFFISDAISYDLPDLVDGVMYSLGVFLLLTAISSFIISRTKQFEKSQVRYAFLVFSIIGFIGFILALTGEFNPTTRTTTCYLGVSRPPDPIPKALGILLTPLLALKRGRIRRKLKDEGIFPKVGGDDE